MLSSSQGDFDHPYPLANKFYRIVLPGIILLTIIISLLMGQGSKCLIEKIYLELSEKKSATIDRALKEKDTHTWQIIQTSSDPLAVYQTPKGKIVLQKLRDEVNELGLAYLKIYGKNGLLIYSSEEDGIGTFDISAGYNSALAGVRNLVNKEFSNGTKLHELYVKVPNNPNQLVMELYEPVGYLDSISMQVIIPALPLPFLC